MRVGMAKAQRDTKITQSYLALFVPDTLNCPSLKTVGNCSTLIQWVSEGDICDWSGDQRQARARPPHLGILIKLHIDYDNKDNNWVVILITLTLTIIIISNRVIECTQCEIYNN